MFMFKVKLVKPSSGWNQVFHWPSLPVFRSAKSAKHFALFRSTKMTSAAPGANISQVEVSNISRHGFWLLLDDEELFLPFAEFP